jgi:hypothetical protein
MKGYPLGQEEIGFRAWMHMTPIGRTRQKPGEKSGLEQVAGNLFGCSVDFDFEIRFVQDRIGLER